MSEWQKPAFMRTSHFKDVLNQGAMQGKHDENNMTYFYPEEFILWKDSHEDHNPVLYITLADLTRTLKNRGYSVEITPKRRKS